MQYEAFGSLKQLTYGNSLSLTQNWGNDGRLAEKRVYKTSGGANVSRLTYAYDNDDNMVGITDAVDATRSVEYQYDSMGRLMRADANASATTVALKRTDWVHDKNGNRTRVERRANAADAAAAETDSYATTTGTNRLASVTTATGVRSITYDTRGNTVSETRPNAVGVTAAYDGFGRLTSYARTGEASLAHVYNGMDQRVTMTRGTDTRRFVYDRMGRVLGEYGTSATDVKAEFIWLHPDNDNTPFGGDDGIGGYAPLAVAANDNAGVSQLSWVHSNHMGVPIAYTNSAGTAIPQPAGYQAPMFPGQNQTLADLYYNMYRDYDPTTGRYIQADPIGLAGDPNPYAYAMNNPVRYMDPDGLEMWNLFPMNELNIRKAADKTYGDLPPHFRDGFVHIFAHGSPNVLCVGASSGKSCYTPEQFKKFMTWAMTSKLPIMIWACQTGYSSKGVPSFAAKLSKELGGRLVIAPTGNTYWHASKGFIKIWPDASNKPGKFVIFGKK
jgi:RHS repeat-associated protein